jgi:DNA-binding transcriptional LysR family regulator
MAARDLNDLYFFVQVVQHNGFAAAGRALGTPKSTLSRRIHALETRLGARLLQRTSRRFVVTDAGREFLRHAKAMLLEADAADDSVKRRLAEPSGIVRFTCPVGMAPLLAPLLPRFLERHGKVALEQQVTNRFVDLVEEGLDVALRGHKGPLPDSGLVERRLMTTPWVLVASPVYLDRAGWPESPADLEAHAALVLGGASAGGGDRWTLVRAAVGAETVSLAPRLRSDDVQSVRAAALGGAGIAAMPDYLCRKDLDAGTLERVLPEWSAGDGMITLLVPSRRGQLPSVRAFMDFLVEEFPRAVGLPAPERTRTAHTAFAAGRASGF